MRNSFTLLHANAFDNARKYSSGGDGTKTIVVVLLDEVGLAEESPHLPLKVLHKELENPGLGISCIGISNWALDAAKMSRAVHLYRSPPTIDDLTLTAEGMISNSQLKMYLRSLAEAFHTVYKDQRRNDFWGLREFYSTVRVVNAELKLRAARGEPENLDADCLLKTVLRNFGGCTEQEMNDNIFKFFSKVGMRSEDATRYTITELIKQNLEETDARHLMLLTKNNSALRLLYDADIVSHDRETEVMFGSSFPDDQNDVMVATNLNKIRSVMTKPIQLVLVHCDALYESLYDLLNQHYMEFSGQRYVRIAHGASSKQCPIHHKFRVIVIVEKSDAWTRLAPPLLNRFEKQIFVRLQLLYKKEDLMLLRRLEEWLEKFVQDIEVQTTNGATRRNRSALRTKEQLSALRRRCIPGFHSDILPSLVVSLQDRTDVSTEDNLDGSLMDVDTSDAAKEKLDRKFGRALHRLCWVLTPEAVTTHMSAVAAGNSVCFQKFNPNEYPYYPNIGPEYFEKQHHGDLQQFVVGLEASMDAVFGEEEVLPPLNGPPGAVGDPLGDENKLVSEAMTDMFGGAESFSGQEVMCMTYTPMIGGSVLADVIKQPGRSVEHFLLHTLSSASSLEQLVNDFFFPKDYYTESTDSDQQLFETGGGKKETLLPTIGEDEDVEMGGLSPAQAAMDGGGAAPAFAAASSSRSSKHRHSYLLIEADPIASSDRQIEHCRCIVEKIRHQYKRGEASTNLFKHVILVVHLSRSRSETSNFLLDFDRRWRAVFIDAVAMAERSGLPDLTSMLNKPLRDVMHAVDFKYVLTNQCLRPSLARLVYPSRRGAAELKQQIENLLGLCKNAEFIQLFRSLALRVLDRAHDEDEKDYQLKLRAEAQRILQEGSTVVSHLGPRLLYRMRRRDLDHIIQ